MALIFCYFIAYVQLLSAGHNLWGLDPRVLTDMPLSRNTFFVGLFLVAHLLGLAGAVLMLQRARLGFILSIVHHLLLVPALVVTSWGLVMLLDDRINVTLLFMSKPTGSDISFFWSLGWRTVFQQVTVNVANGSTYVGLNLFAFTCATIVWVGMDELSPARAQPEMRVRQRQRQGKRPLALPAPQSYTEQPRMRQQQRRPAAASRTVEGRQDYDWARR